MDAVRAPRGRRTATPSIVAAAAVAPGVPRPRGRRDEVLAAMSRHRHPAGPASRSAGFARRRRSSDVLRRRRRRLVAVLAHVRDPGNAGTVMRGADAAGADAVVLTDASVDLYNPKVVRATAGSLFHLPVAVGVPVAQAVGGLRAAGVRVLAADGAGERTCRARRWTSARPHRLGLRQRGVGAAGGDPARSPTRSCGCRSTAGPRASTSRPPPPSASTPPPVRSARPEGAAPSPDCSCSLGSRHASGMDAVRAGRGAVRRSAPDACRSRVGRRRARHRPDDLPDGLVVADEDGRVICFNAAAARITATSPAEQPLGRTSASVRCPWRTCEAGAGGRCTDPYGGPGHPRRPAASEPAAARRPRGARRPPGTSAPGRSRAGAPGRRRAARRRGPPPHRGAATPTLIATVAHELRSPLTSVKGFTATLLGASGTGSPTTRSG